jgi:hypothetical protein
MNKEVEIKVFSSKSRKIIKQNENKPYWENTHPTENGVKQSQESDTEDEGVKSKPKGYSLLKKIYGGCGNCSQLISPKLQSDLGKRYKKVSDNYSDVVKHLEEHQSEGVGDIKDVKQSKYLRREIKRINALHLTPANQVAGDDTLYKYSNPKEVQKKAFQLYGNDAVVYKSDKKEKKYMILDENTGKFVYFGQVGYEDFTHHHSEDRRNSYLRRASNIKGDWKTNVYSPNFLAISLLW